MENRKKSTLFVLAMAVLLTACSGNERSKKDKKEEKTVKVHNPTEGMSDGLNTTKYPGGQKHMEGEVVQGKRHGVWTTWHENGVKWSENHYNLGSLEGKTVSYYESGQVKYIGYYTNNKRSGKWSFYDEKGNLEKEETY